MNKTESNFNYFVSLHQLFGGIFGIGFIIFTSLIEYWSFWSLLCIAIFTFSIVAGYKYFNKSKYGLEFTMANYFIQVVGFSVGDTISYTYNLGPYVQLGYDFSESFIVANFGIMSDFRIIWGNESSYCVMINIVALVVLISLIYGDEFLKHIDFETPPF